MPRKKKDGRFINYYIDRTIYARLERYAQAKGQQMTTAIERILQEHLDRYEKEAAAKGGKSMYCSNCNILFQGTYCPVCRNQDVRLPQDGDYCYLTEKESIWVQALSDIFTEHGIPFLTKNVLGAGLSAKLGSAMERVRFYVPWFCYQEATELERQFFSGEM